MMKPRIPAKSTIFERERMPYAAARGGSAAARRVQVLISFAWRGCFLSECGRKSNMEFAIVTALRGNADATSNMGKKTMSKTSADDDGDGAPRPLKGKSSHMRVTGEETDVPK